MLDVADSSVDVSLADSLEFDEDEMAGPDPEPAVSSSAGPAAKRIGVYPAYEQNLSV